MTPLWLHWLSIIALIAGALSALWIASDVRAHPQHMWIMALVWPLVALFGGPLAVWAYLRLGRNLPGAPKRSFPQSVAVGTSHCGAGCTLGDICAEWLVVAVPGLATLFGYPWLFQTRMFAVWGVDFLFAFVIGIAFQYYAIKPMSDMSPGAALVAALKADTLSLSAWQVGMYGFMALAHFVVFPVWLGAALRVPTPEFWFMMQIAMLCGFATAYPVNWWLVRRGIKHAM